MQDTGSDTFSLSVFWTVSSIGLISGLQFAAGLWPEFLLGSPRYVQSGEFQSIILLLLPLAAVVTIWHVQKCEAHATTTKVTFSAVALISLVLSVSDSEISQFGLWAGFGVVTAASSLVMLASVLVLHRFSLTERVVTSQVPLLGKLFVVTACLPALLQHQNGLSNLGDSTYIVLDELLAPSLGAYPYVNYTPTYGAVLGLLMTPMRLLPVSGAEMMTFVVVWSNIFILLVPVLVTAILRIVFPRLSRLTLFTSFTILYVASGPDNTSTAVREFSHFSRYVPCLLALLLLLKAVGAHESRAKTVWCWAAGVGLGLAALNNLSFGLSLAVSCALLLCAMTVFGLVRKRHVFFVFGGIAGTVFSYITILAWTVGPFSISSYLGLSADPFGLYNFLPLRWMGAHVLVMSLAVWAMAAALKEIRIQSQPRMPNAATFILLAGATGSWTILLIFKWLQRPLREDVHLYLVPTFIIGVLLVARQLTVSSAPKWWWNHLLFAPVLLLAVLPFASVSHIPNPIDEVKRLTGRYAGSTSWSSVPGRPSDGWSPQALAIHDDFVTVVESLSEALSEKGGSVGYFGYMGHTVELLAGVDSYLGVPAPELLRFGGKQVEFACARLKTSSPDFLIVYNSAYPCGGYQLTKEPSNVGFLVLERLEVDSR
jgi:uncharacterized membrane protein YecN with MAPEG domain